MRVRTPIDSERRKGGVRMKRKKALKKQLKKLMKTSEAYNLLKDQVAITDAIVKIARETRK